MDESFLITISGCSLLAGALLVWLATRPSYRVRVTPLPMRVGHYDRADATVIIERKRRLAFRWSPVGGTFIVAKGAEGRVAVCPTLGSSAADETGFALELTGLEPGADRVRISATPAGATSALVTDVPVTVTPDERGARRIRDTAAVLTRATQP